MAREGPSVPEEASPPCNSNLSMLARLHRLQATASTKAKVPKSIPKFKPRNKLRGSPYESRGRSRSRQTLLESQGTSFSVKEDVATARVGRRAKTAVVDRRRRRRSSSAGRRRSKSKSNQDTKQRQQQEEQEEHLKRTSAAGISRMRARKLAARKGKEAIAREQSQTKTRATEDVRVWRKTKQNDVPFAKLPQWLSRPATVASSAASTTSQRGSVGGSLSGKENFVQKSTKSRRRSKSGHRPLSAEARGRGRQREREKISSPTSDKTASVLQAAIDNFTNGTTLKALQKQLRESERRANMHSEFIRKVRETWITTETAEASMC